MKKITFYFLITFILQFNNSFGASYTFQRTNELYSELVSDSVINQFPVAGLYIFSNLETYVMPVFNLPFTFGGLTTIAVGQTGFMRIDNDSSTVLLDALNTQLQPIDSTSKITFNMLGRPETILQVQYKNMRITNGPIGNYVNFQVWIYIQSGMIEFRYGNSSPNVAAGFNQSNGPRTGISYSNDQFTRMYEKMWLMGNPQNPTIDSAASFSFPAITGVPASNTVYRYTPSFTLELPVLTQNNFEISYSSEEIIINPIHSTLTIRLMDIQGNLLKEVKSDQLINMSTIQLSAGIYLLAIETDKNRMVYKFYK